MEVYIANIRIQFKCEKMWTAKALNKDTFYSVNFKRSIIWFGYIHSLCFFHFNHSHKKQKDSLETPVVLLIFSLELEISGVAVFHSMLAVYAILVPTLYGNRETRLHGFRQHQHGWLKVLFA